MNFYCEKCHKEYPVESHSYTCECGGLFRLRKDEKDLPVCDVTIGEGVTPLLEMNVGGLDVRFKMESMQPTGSFKDRGAYTLINEINNLGIKKIALDSAGNAGTAIAAYAAAAGMDCTVYVPDDVSREKLDQMEAYGAKTVKVANGRMRACEEVKANLGDAYYASHVYNPLFIEGTKSIAYELYEQLGGQVPEYVFMPVGNGTLLIGLYLGFKELGRLPRLVAVQSSKCAPLYDAWKGLPESPKSTTVAQAIRIEKPRRQDEIIAAIKESDGDVLTVDDDEIIEAKKNLGKCGIYAEVTSAAALAGALNFFRGEDGQIRKPDNWRVIIPITAHGLKR